MVAKGGGDILFWTLVRECAILEVKGPGPQLGSVSVS
jgi:hypothetical protein